MFIPGHKEVVAVLEKALHFWEGGDSAVVFINGEHGTGKSYVLDVLEASIKESARNVVRVDCRPPIGSFNVAAIQPLQPFGHAIEQLYLNGEQVAKKRLAMNIGMSVLASIPIAGDIFYAVKAITADVTEYKRETSALQTKKRAAVDDCANTLERIAKDSPIALLIDDAQWSDAQSVEVVKRIMHWQPGIPLLIVWASSSALVKKHNPSLSALLREKSTTAQLINLGSVNVEGAAEVIRTHAPSFKPTPLQTKLLFERSAGNPGIIVEYVRYLERTKQVDADGHIADTALTESGLSLSDHPATDVALHEISEQDAMTLALCAAEGREFTAFVVSALMNVDVLTAIRTLRRLQHTTSTIKSIGMRTRYGVKTTTYEFTSAVAYTHFSHYPEYEERKSIHQRIAEILSKEHSASDLDEVRQQLSAFIAAHSSEAEDTETTQRMLIGNELAANISAVTAVTAATADSADSADTAATADSADTAATAGYRNPSEAIDAACDLIISSEPANARAIAVAALKQDGCTTREKTILRCLAARADIELGRLADAYALLDAAESDMHMSNDDRCLILNTRAVAALLEGDVALARTLLADAAQLTSDSQTVSRMITVSNMLLALRAASDQHADQYQETVERMSTLHGWSQLRIDLISN